MVWCGAASRISVLLLCSCFYMFSQHPAVVVFLFLCQTGLTPCFSVLALPGLALVLVTTARGMGGSLFDLFDLCWLLEMDGFPRGVVMLLPRIFKNPAESSAPAAELQQPSGGL